MDEGIRPDAWNDSPNVSSIAHLAEDSRYHPSAQRWAKRVSNAMREAGGDVRALTLTGDVALDFPIGTLQKGERPRYVHDAVTRRVINTPERPGFERRPSTTWPLLSPRVGRSRRAHSR